MPERVRPAPEAPSNGPTKELHDDVLAEFTELKTQAQRTAQKIKTCLGRYEAAGGTPDEIKFSHKLGKLEKGEAQAHVKRLNRAAGWSGIISWQENGQASFEQTFDASEPAAGVAPGSRLALARAYNDGYNSGRHGAAIDTSPFDHAPGSAEFTKWRGGWQDGAEDRGEPAEAEVNTSRRRGRPPRDATPDVIH